MKNLSLILFFACLFVIDGYGQTKKPPPNPGSALEILHSSKLIQLKANERIERRVYQLKKFVEAMLRFHIRNYFGFESLSESGEFLDLPANSDALKKKAKMFRKAIKYRP